MKTLIAVVVIISSVPIVAEAQVPPVKNPTQLAFTSVDHAASTGYEIDIVTPTAAVLQTLTIAKAATTVLNGEVLVTVNVQPVTFGTYTFVARTLVNTLKSSNSLPSDSWERAPGQPSKPRVASLFHAIGRAFAALV